MIKNFARAALILQVVGIESRLYFFNKFYYIYNV